MNRTRLYVSLLIIATAVVLGIVPIPSSLVEQDYSNGIYPLINWLITPVTNLLPFAVVDILLVLLLAGLPAWWILRLVRARRGARLRTLPWLVLETLTAGAVVYLLFAVLWGLNYQRQPLTFKLDSSSERITPEAEKELYDLTVRHLNQDAPAVHSRPFPGDTQMLPALHNSFESSVQSLGTNFTTYGVEPKASILNGYLEATAVSGFTDPWTHEVILAQSLLPFERPFVLAHEWSHLAGYASESEANFIGLLTCIRSDQPFIRYSGWLSLYGYLPQPKEDQAQLDPLVVADLDAIRARIAAHEVKQVRQREEDAYDKYLKANRVEQGIGNYGLFVRLVLGTRFTENWVPQRRGISSVLESAGSQAGQ